MTVKILTSVDAGFLTGMVLTDLQKASDTIHQKILLILFRMGRKSPPPSTSFASVTSANVGISPQNFLTFNFNTFNTFATLV